MTSPEPITLATLELSTAQEVFDWVAFNLLKQCARSQISENFCAYRGANGRKCAAGWLIADHEYCESMEAKSWGHLVGACKVPGKHAKLIAELQEVHDATLPDDWKEELRKVAFAFDLNTELLDSLK